MRGELAFEKFGEIDLGYVMESAPRGSKTPAGAPVASTPHKDPFFSRHGGSVAAVVCGILAVGIYVGILVSRPDSVEPTLPGDTVGSEVGSEEDFQTEEAEELTVDTQSQVTEEATEAESETQREIIQIPDTYITPYFVVEQIDGRTRLNFYNGEYDHGIWGILSPVVFADMDAMFEGFYYGKLTEEQRAHIHDDFIRHPQGYWMFDLNGLYEPVIPEGGSYVSVEVTYNDVYAVTYLLAPDTAPVRFHFNSGYGNAQAELEIKLKRREDDGYLSKTTFDIGGQTATAYTSTPPATNDEPQPRGCLVDVYWAETTEAYPLGRFVEYQYRQAEDGSITQLDFSLMYYREDKSFKVGQSMTDAREIQAFMDDPYAYFGQFDIRPYTPPVTEEQLRPIPDIPYEVHEVEGITYLRFPEQIDLLGNDMPADTEDLAWLYFETAEDLYNAIYNDGLTLYQRMLLLSYPTTEHGVRIGDMSQLMVANVPEPYKQMVYYYITIDGEMGAVGRTDADAITESIYFNIYTKESWEEALAAARDVSDMESKDGFTVRNGTLDGIHCVFYGYKLADKGSFADWSRISCQFSIGEGEDVRHVVWTLEVTEDWQVLFETEDGGIHLMLYDLFGGSVCLPGDASIFGQSNGVYYRYGISPLDLYSQIYPEEGLEEGQSLVQDLLLKFTPTPYVP